MSIRSSHIALLMVTVLAAAFLGTGCGDDKSTAPPPAKASVQCVFHASSNVAPSSRVRVKPSSPDASPTITVDLVSRTHDGADQSQSVTVPVVDNSAHVSLEVEPGVGAAEVTFNNCDYEGYTDFGGATQILEGHNILDLGVPDADDNDYYRRYQGVEELIYDPAAVQRLLSLPWDYYLKLAASSEFARYRDASINFFDNVKVSDGSGVILEEKFDGTQPGSYPSSLDNLWSGSLGYVISDATAPSQSNSFLNEAYENWNRHDGILLGPSSFTSGHAIFQVSCYMWDSQKGTSFGFKKLNDDGSAYDNAGILFIDNGVVQVGGVDRVLATFQEQRWYTFKADVNLDTHRISVWMDGNKIGDDIPLFEHPETGYDFDWFTFGGTNFLYE